METVCWKSSIRFKAKKGIIDSQGSDLLECSRCGRSMWSRLIFTGWVVPKLAFHPGCWESSVSGKQKCSGEWPVFGHVPFFLWDIRVHAEITPNSRSLGSPKLHNSIGAPSLLILTTLFGKIQQARPPAGPLTASSTSQMLQAGDLWARRKQSL